MTVKSEVQGVVQALFGAYAGGYLAELTAEATANGTSAVAARLASVQGIILGQNLSSNATFVDTILSNMGVTSTNAAYNAASTWANNELTAGASRADVVTAAVAFLTGIAAGTIVDSNYTAVATAFAAKVEAGVEYSETEEGSAVLNVADLQAEAGFEGAFNLTTALTTLLAAQEAVAEHVAAWGEANDVDDATEADITGAVTDAENAINVLTNGEYDPTETAAQKTAALASVNADLAAVLTGAKEDLVTSTAAVADVAGLKTAIDRFITEYDASEDAIAATALADAAEDEALAAADVYYLLTDGTTGTDSTDYLTISLTTGRATNATTAAVLIADGLTASEAGVYLTKLTALANAMNAQLAANAAEQDALALAQTRLDTIGTLTATADGIVTTGATAAAELVTIANAYAVDVVAVSDAQDDIDDLAELVADLAAAEADADELEALTDAVDDAVTALEDEDFAVEMPGTDSDDDGDLDDELDFVSTADSDVFIISESLKDQADFDADNTTDDTFAAITIDNFGFQGDDIIYASGWTLGADIDEGDNSVLELFIEQDGANTLITFESTAFGSNAATPEVFTVTLTGVAAADVSFSNGYIQVA